MISENMFKCKYEKSVEAEAQGLLHVVVCQ